MNDDFELVLMMLVAGCGGVVPRSLRESAAEHRMRTMLTPSAPITTECPGPADDAGNPACDGNTEDGCICGPRLDGGGAVRVVPEGRLRALGRRRRGAVMAKVKLVHRRHGQILARATVEDAGSIRYAGKLFTSLSAAASAAARRLGMHPSVNGRTFWTAVES